MDDLEQAILLIYDPGAAVDPALRSHAIAYCDQAKSDPSAALRLSFHRLSRPSASVPVPVPVQFWCLQALHDLLRLRFSALPPADLPLLRSSLLSLAAPGLPASAPPFLKNKLAQVLVALIVLEYPDPFPSPFIHLLSLLPSSADMLLRLLAALDDDLISKDYNRSPAESAAAARVKDAMRAQCAPQIARALFDIARATDPALAAQALDITRRYVAWIDIGLVANDAFVPLLFDLSLASATPDPVRAAAAGCILAIVCKRMEPRPKLALLQSLRVSQVFADPEQLPKLATLVTGYATEALDCYKKLGVDNPNGFSSMELVEETLPSVFYVMQNCEEVDSGNMVEFLSGYVSSMKLPSQSQLGYLSQILGVIRSQILYDPAYRTNLDIPDKIGQEEEEHMREHRKDLFTLFCSVCRVAPEVAQLFIRNLLASTLTSSETNVEDVEAALSLFYRLGKTVSEEAVRKGSGLLGELIPMLLSVRFSCHSHRIVALVYLETIVRYMKFVLENSQYIPHVLAVFLDERGINHPNLNVSRRASYLFMKAVKLMKDKLAPFIDTIMQSLQDTLCQFTSVNWTSKEQKCSDSEDGSQTFEAIGLLIGMEGVLPEKQSAYLAALIDPLCRQVESLLLDAKVQGLEESSARAVSLQQITMALNALSKGFSERLVTSGRPAIGDMFKQTLDVLLQVLVMFPNIKPLRNKITSFLHRMVDILGVSILPCLPMALKQLLMGSEPKDMVDFLLLINQVICKFSTSTWSILEEIFPTIASRLFFILSSDAFPSGPACNTEEIRELQELQRTLYVFLHVMAMHDLSSVFLAPNNRGCLDATMQLLLLSSCSHKDMFLRKICVQIFVKLTKDWCTKYNGEDKVPGFKSFIIEKFAINCCLYSVLDKSFEFHDANTLVLFGEIVLAQKVMYEKFGDDFIIHFVSKGLPSAHCPLHLAELYIKELKGNDIKVFKSFYQSLIENLRQQQNATLVCR